MLNKLKKFLGFKETWHVSFVIYIKGHNTSYGDSTYTFRPKLTKHLIADFRQSLAIEAMHNTKLDIDACNINIMGLTKL
jgi:hypothetical protein